VTTDRADVAALWEAHRRAAFPPRLRGADVAGVDVVTLDATVAGCVSTWLENGGSLDDRARTALSGCRDDLAQVLPELAGEEAAYLARLRDLAALILGDAGT
jgi:hypothetical protein